MQHDLALEQLIGVIYEAVLDPGRWQEAVRLCALYAGGEDAQMLIIAKPSLQPLLSIQAGSAFDLQSGQDYAEYYIKIDPRFPLVTDYPIDQWTSCHDIHDQNFVNRNEFYQDFLLPSKARYVHAARIDETEEQFTMFGILRAIDQSPFTIENTRAAKRFSGHLQRALHLQRQAQQLKLKAELGAMAIDVLAIARLLVDAKGAILHLNAHAENALRNPSSGLCSKAGRLLATHTSTKSQLSQLISDATSSPAVGGAMFLNHARTQQLFVIPLPANSRFAENWQLPLAFLIILPIGTNVSNLHLFAELYALSPTELRVVTALMQGKSAEEYAQEMGVTMNTVRTQLKSIYKKTNTRRQSELLLLLNNLPPLVL